MKHDAPPDWIGYQMGPTRDYHNEIRAELDAVAARLEKALVEGAKRREERDALRAEVEQLRDSRIRHLETETKLVAEVERLTRERDYWERARNEWEKSANMLEEENKCLRAERDRALSLNSINEKSASNIQVLCEGHKVRAEAAERKLAMAVEALIAIERDRDNRWKSQKARAALAALEKNDE